MTGAETNGNRTHACADCGARAVVMVVCSLQIGSRLVWWELCGRCHLRRAVDQ